MDWEMMPDGALNHTDDIGIDKMPAPTAGIFDAPTYCTRINTEWLSFIIARLEILTSPKAWDGTEAQKVFAGQQIDEFLLSLMEGGDCPPENVCAAVLPHHPAIEWQPNDPFTTPDLLPPGYNFPPWTVAGEGNILYSAGTVYTDLNRLPTNLLDIILSLDFDGFPRFKFSFSGTGKVRLYLQEIPQGGLAFISLDGSLASGEFVDLSSLDLLDFDDYTAAIESLFDLLGNDVIDGGLNALRIVEVNVESPGDHYIDVTMLPKISSENILGFGGAIQKIEICGTDIELIECPDCPDCPDCEECPEPPPVVPPELRQVGDCVEWLNPATEQWECLLQLQPVPGSAAAADCDCEDDDDCGEDDDDCESEECDECA